MKHKTSTRSINTANIIAESDTDPESIKTLDKMRREINYWHNEHDAWLDDIVLWEREYKLAELMIYKMERTLHLQDRAINQHTEIIQQHKKHISDYEKNLNDYIDSDHESTAQYKSLLNQFRLHEEQHLKERQRHKLYTDTHISTMTELMRITKMLESTD